MKDEVFIRGKVPMTKAEVRAVSIDLLSLDEKSKKLLDVGAGTGSVGLQVACNFPKIHVTAIERNPDAVDLIKQNQAKFGLENIAVIEAYAPMFMTTLEIRMTERSKVPKHLLKEKIKQNRIMLKRGYFEDAASNEEGLEKALKANSKPKEG